MGTLVYIMKLSALHSTRGIHVLRFLAIVIFCLAINACAQNIEEDDFYEAPQRHSGGVSMLRLKKNTDEEVRNHMQDLLYKRAMSMMRLRRAPSLSWERPIRGPSMMRLKRRMPSQPMIMKDMESELCNEYPELC